MAVPQLIRLPETIIYYGGSKTLFEAHAPLLRVFGGNAAYLGDDHGAPLLYDLALLTMLYGSVYGYLHAHAFLSTANISPTAFLPFATNWVNHVIAPSITSPDSARALEERNYATDVSPEYQQTRAGTHYSRQQGAGYPGRMAKAPARHCFAASR